MKITLICTALIAASFAVGLTGCAGVSTDVRASPSATPLQGERSYVLARSPLQDDTPDHREYETLIRTELGKYGFADATELHAHYMLSIAYDTRLAGVGIGTAECTGGLQQSRPGLVLAVRPPRVQTLADFAFLRADQRSRSLQGQRQQRGSRC